MDRKQQILKQAIAMFAERGVDAATTLHIAEAIGITEPLIFYYFKNKDGLFAEIIQTIFTEYFARLGAQQINTASEFENIKQLIEMHLEFVEAMPAESYLVVSACPAKLRDSLHICTRNIEDQRNRLNTFITGCIQRGIKKGEFGKIPVKGTTRLIIALLNGLIRQEALSSGIKSDEEGSEYMNMKKIAVDFCRRSLVKY